ncbi:MAG: GldG family protein [Deltaproteobacteria bacterium]|nr:GldG family protein [Deltaproteobacteria bacterium]
MSQDPTPTKSPARSAEGALKEGSALATVGLVAGVVGLTAVIFGVVLYALDPQMATVALGNIGFGIAGIALYVVTNWKSVTRAAAGRSTTLVILEVVIGVGLLAAMATANYFSVQNPKEWDLTKDGLYSLHEQSVLVAKGLKQKVTVYGFFRSSEPARATLTQAISLYRNHTDQLELVFINPDAPPPELETRFDLKANSPRIVVAAGNGRFAKLKTPTEEAMTNALLKVAERPARTVRALGGHGEPSIADLEAETSFAVAASSLRNEGYQVDPVSLIDQDRVPEGTSLLWVAGPQSPLFANEVAALRNFLERGGRAVILVEPGVDSGLAGLLADYGVTLGDDLVIEPNPAARAQGFGPDVPVVQNFEPHPITNLLRNNAALFFRARSLLPKAGQPNLEVVTLVQTGPTSWAESAYREEGEPARDENDVPGPVPIAVAITQKTSTHPEKLSDEARLVVFGDQHFASARYAPMGVNGDLFLNAVNWAAGEEDRITIRPRSNVGDRLPLTESQQQGIVFFSVNLLPLLITGFGFSVWAVRRKK